MNQKFSQDNDDDVSVVGYGDEDDKPHSPEQSQDGRDADAAVHSKYDYIARKRLGLVGRDNSNSMLMGSEDLARDLQQQRSLPRADLNQNLTNIIQQYNDPDAAAPASQHDNEHLLPGHGDYSPKPLAAAHSPAPAAFSPRGRLAGHALDDSPGGGRLTAASQATGNAPAAARQQFPPHSATATAAPVLGGGAFISAGGIQVDEELLQAFHSHKATSPPNTKKKDTRRHQQQQQHGAYRRAAPGPSLAHGGATMSTPGPTNPAANNNNINPLLSLLASAKGNSGSARGPGSGGNGMPPYFRQPALGTPGGHGQRGGGGLTIGATVGPSRFQREQQNRNTAYATTPAAATGRIPPPFPQLQQQQQQQQQQDVILSSEDEEEENPAGIDASGGGGMDTPVAAHVSVFGANAGAAAPTSGAAAPGSGSGSAQRLTGPQDTFLANLAPPSTRVTHGNVRSRLGGAAGAAGGGLQGRLKRVRLADEHAAAAALNTNANTNNTNRNTLEAIIQGRGIEGSVLKLRGLCRNAENAYFIIGSKAADRTDLTLGRKMVIAPPWREVPPSEDGIKVYMCSGEVSAQ